VQVENKVFPAVSAEEFMEALALTEGSFENYDRGTHARVSFLSQSLDARSRDGALSLVLIFS
jgi:hypothetical protein